MRNLENLRATGALSIVLNRENGETTELHLKNLVVASGLNFIVNRMKDPLVAVMSHMSVGEDTTAAVTGNTDLGSQIVGSRVALTSTAVVDNTITYVATFDAGVGTGAVTEAGVFNADTGGTMLCRTVFPVVNKQAGDSMTVTWTVTVS